MMFSTHTKMPRDVGPLQAAAVLYGDWGTSKAYVIGLAFALAGHTSFWLIALVGFLNILVGLNYMVICKYYPNGGGVYASVRHHSKVLALLGAFFLIADYMVTASLSALSAFYYFGALSPSAWAMSAIIAIGAINFFGPRYSAKLAVAIALPTCFVMILLGMLTLPNLGTAIENLEPLKGDLGANWITFVSIIVALSGIESIANITGVMKLDPGSTLKKPSVTKTASKAILWVTIEVVTLTTLFGLATNALPGLTFADNTVNAPGQPDVRDYMLRYMGLIFGTYSFGPEIGQVISYTVSTVIGILLLSAVNTALIALESLLFVVASDRELPLFFKNLNPFGVPFYALIAAAIMPLTLLYLHADIAELADLYAIGFIGAIATNLGVTSINKELPLKTYERIFMFSTFCVMLLIEITLFIEKPHAANYVITILAIGLFLRGVVVESYERKASSRKETLARHRLSGGLLAEQNEQSDTDLKEVTIYAAPESEQDIFDPSTMHIHEGSLMCAATHVGKTLEFAIQKAKIENQLLYVLFVREQRILTQSDKEKEWWEDEEACKIVDHLVHICHEMKVKFVYSVSDSPADSIVESARNSKISRLILGLSRKSKLRQLLQGNFISRISKVLPPEIDLIIIS